MDDQIPSFEDELTSLSASPQAAKGSSQLDSILQIPVAVQVLIGSASMPVADLMKLGRGAVIPLNHGVAEPVDVVVNGRIIARGEMVVLKDDPSRVGVRLTEIVHSAATAG